MEQTKITKIEAYNERLRSIGASNIKTNRREYTPYEWLKYVENWLHERTIQYTNGGIDQTEYRKHQRKALENCKKVFPKLPEGFFLNSDPRGYCLKIESEEILPLQRDMGGYYLLAPEL